MAVPQWFCVLLFRLRSLFSRKRMDEELNEELRDHLELQIEENLARGMSPQDARSSALRALGGVTQTKEQCRDARGVNFMQNFFRDLRYGIRQLRRGPGFSVLAILCLTLGIGANATVFSWVEGILLRPYPAVAHQQRLVAVGGIYRSGGEVDEDQPLSWPDYLDLERSCALCETTFVSTITGATLSIGERAEVATGSIVSANYFDAIGVRPFLGRGFELGEDTGRKAHPVVVISYQLWQQRFNADQQIVGKTQRLEDVVYTIVGVTPKGFYGTFVGREMSFWVPASMQEALSGSYQLEDRGARWIESYARLKPGVTLSQAQQEFAAISQRLEADYPATNRGRAIRPWPLWRTPFNHARELLPVLEIMLVVAAFVFLIACANVSNLLLVKAFARRQEITVRLAIGAGRGRLWKQLLTEGLLLSALGAVGGLLIGYWSRHALALLLPALGGGTLHLPGEMDLPVLALSIGICLVATLIVGIVPALQTRKVDLASALKAGSLGVVGLRGKAWVRSSLVVLQVCLSFVLLVGAGLLVESLHKVRTVNPGFSASRVLESAVPLVAAGYDVPRAKTFQDELMDRVRPIPGVESAAYARLSPLGYASYSSAPIAVDGYVLPPGEQPTVEYNQVGPEYFVTMGIPLISGREFARSDDENAAPVAVVNETMVQRYWQGRNPVGQRLQVQGRWAQVVGVATNSKYESMDERAKPFFYVPLRQNFVREPSLLIRTTQPVQAIAPVLASEVRKLDSGLALYETTTLQEQVDRSTSAQFVAVTLVGILGGLALLLASIGLYGVMSYTVSESARELGLRMALGAGAAKILRMVISRGLLLTAAGLLLGVFMALALTRSLGSYLYDVSPRNPLAFASGFLVMTLTALAACLLPAWRATRTDPARVLRIDQ
jgi:predicted permease